MGDSTASLISPRKYEALVLPYTAELIARFQKAGAKVKYHACGRTRALLPLFRQLGADIINLDSLVDLAEARAVLGDGVCIKGNLDPVGVLLNGTPEDVIRTARQCIAAAGGGNRFILSPGCEVPRDTPPENLVALVQAARTYGRHPLPV